MATNNDNYYENTQMGKSIMMRGNNSKVVKRFRSDNVQASVWKEKVEWHGRMLTRYSVSIQRRAQDYEAWQDISSLIPEDFPAINTVLLDAYVYLCNREAFSRPTEHLSGI